MTRRKSTRVRDRAWETMNADDRISRLPEGVIHHIFSFLDTRFVVRSSLLSSRWRDTWKSHPRLNFKINRSINQPRNLSLPKFMHRFLSNRDNSVDISIIDVRLNSIKLPLLKEMIIYAMSHGTQKLSIEFSGEGPTRRGGFDLSIFRSQFLKHLCLDVDFVVLKTPNLIWDLPALTTLDLKGVKFTLDHPNEGGGKSLELFSCMPNLKTLVLVSCKLLNIDSFIIMSNGLENLSMKDLNQTCEFVISAPKLLSFTYYGMPSLSLLANNLHSLERVKFHTIYLRSLEKQEEVVELMFNTFYQLRKAKFLTINVDLLRFLTGFPILLERRYCPFKRLQCLTLVERRLFPGSVPYGNVFTYFRSSSPALTVNIVTDPSQSINYK